MIKIDKKAHRLGLIFGGIFSGIHLIWSILVLLNLAQSLMDFVLWAHMIHLPMKIGPFCWINSLVLILYTFSTGYLLGVCIEKIKR